VQGSAKVIQKRHSLGPIEFIQSRKVSRVDGPASYWNNYDSC
jgi:hypothetical protein